MDIYDELEQLVPQERKEAFLRLSRQLKEFGDHNPELLRLVEAMGFLSLYTEQLPQRLTASIAADRAQLTAELKALYAAQLNSLAGASDQLQKHVAALHDAGQSAQSLATQLSFPDADKIRATVERNAQTAQTIERLQPDYIKQHLDNLKALLDTGVSISVERDQLSGDTVLFFQGTNCVSLYYPRYVDGRYALNVSQ